MKGLNKFIFLCAVGLFSHESYASTCIAGVNYPIPHPTVCEQYYDCDNNQVQLSSCPEGLHFSPDLQVCDVPEFAGCWVVPDEPDTTTEEIVIDTTVPVTEAPTTEGPEITEAPTAVPTTAVPPTEAPATEAPATEAPATEPPATEAPSTDAPTTEEPIIETTERITDSSPIVSSTEGSGFPGEGDCSPGVQYLPHPTDCTKFFECSNGVPYLFDCSPGLHYNKDLFICDWPSSASCEIKSDRFEEANDEENDIELKPEIENDVDNTNEEGKPIPNDPMCPQEGHFFLPDPDDCNKFLECLDGSKFEKDCPPNLHFNPNLEVCDWPNSAGCRSQEKIEEVNALEARKPPICPPHGIVTIPDPENCDQYYKCVHGQWNWFTCPPGLLFNPEYEVCDWPANVDCAKVRRRRSLEGKSKMENTREIPAIPNDPACSAEGDFFLPNPDDCTQFFRCVDGKKYTYICPDGLHFNPSAGWCDWPADAGCQKKNYFYRRV